MNEPPEARDPATYELPEDWEIRQANLKAALRKAQGVIGTDVMFQIGVEIPSNSLLVWRRNPPPQADRRWHQIAAEHDVSLKLIDSVYSWDECEAVADAIAERIEALTFQGELTTIELNPEGLVVGVSADLETVRQAINPNDEPYVQDLIIHPGSIPA